MLYELFTGTCPVKITVNSKQHAHTFATLCYAHYTDARTGGLCGSICNVLSRLPPETAFRAPKLDGRRVGYTVTCVPTPYCPDPPMADLFPKAIRFCIEQDRKGAVAWPRPAAEYGTPPDPVLSLPTPGARDVAAACPAVTDYGLHQREIRVPDLAALQVSSPEAAQQLTVAASDLDAFRSQPLQGLPLSAFVETALPQDDGPCPGLPFDVAGHPHARGPGARRMLGRLASDLATFHEQVRTSRVARVKGLASEAAIRGLSREATADARAALWDLVARLQRLCASDTAFVTAGLRTCVATANRLDLDPSATPEARTVFELERVCGLRSRLWLEYLIASTMSRRCREDWQQHNPFLPGAVAEEMENLLSLILLHTVRVGQANRAMSACHELLMLLEPPGEPPHPAEWGQRVEQKAEALAATLSTARAYASAGPTGGMVLDPRLLCFEFVRNLLLRARQVCPVLSVNRGGNPEVGRWSKGRGGGGHSQRQDPLRAGSCLWIGASYLPRDVNGCLAKKRMNVNQTAFEVRPPKTQNSTAKLDVIPKGSTQPTCERQHTVPIPRACPPFGATRLGYHRPMPLTPLPTQRTYSDQKVCPTAGVICCRYPSSDSVGCFETAHSQQQDIRCCPLGPDFFYPLFRRTVATTHAHVSAGQAQSCSFPRDGAAGQKV